MIAESIAEDIIDFLGRSFPSIRFKVMSNFDSFLETNLHS